MQKRGVFSFLLKISVALLALSTARIAAASEIMSPEEFRLYCGYLTAQQDAKVQKLPHRKQLPKIARMAGVRAKKLKAIIKKGETWTGTCEDISKQAEKDIKAALEKSRVKGRVEFVEVSGAEWDQMVVRIRIMGAEDRFVEEDAATAAYWTHKKYPMVSTMACAVFNPLNPKESWFEGIISNARMGNIQESRIENFSDSRYMRLFDNKKFAKPRS